MSKIKKWNWSGFIFVMLICLMGAMSNKNCKTIGEAFILGIIGGVLFGLPIAIITKDKN